MTAAALAPPVAAAEVQEVVGRSGVRAYLVHEPRLPFISMSFRFTAGAVHDPVGREGLARMAAGLLDEGAGSRDSEAFQAALEDHAIRLGFNADQDAIAGNLKVLNAHRGLAVELLRDALTAPRFDPEPVERVRARMVADLRRREADPGYVASRSWFARAFPGHAYGRPSLGTPESLAAIDAPDLRDVARRRLARAGLAIGVAGDIDAEALAHLLDETFGLLPERPDVAVPVPPAPPAGGLEVVHRPIPQCVVWFGKHGIDHRDPDHWAATVVDYLLGGGGFRSRLMQEVREARGLAYSVWSMQHHTDLLPLWLAGVATSNERVAESIAVMRAEIARMAEGTITAEDLGDAVTYLTGSFPLRLTSNDQVAGMLGTMMARGYGADFLRRRNGLIEAVTRDDANRAAARLLAGDLLVAVVGDPRGLDA